MIASSDTDFAVITRGCVLRTQGATSKDISALAQSAGG